MISKDGYPILFLNTMLKKMACCNPMWQQAISTFYLFSADLGFRSGSHGHLERLRVKNLRPMPRGKQHLFLPLTYCELVETFHVVSECKTGTYFESWLILGLAQQYSCFYRWN